MCTYIKGTRGYQHSVLQAQLAHRHSWIYM